MSRLSDLLWWLVAALLFGFVMAMLLWVTPMKMVASGSMEPMLPTGSRILIHEDPSYQKGDLITFHADEGEVVTHRLIDIADDGSFITKGDANPTTDVWDDPVTESDVIGKVIYMTPLTTLAFWGSWRGILILACLLIMAAAYWWPEGKSSTNRKSNLSTSSA